ncbi:carbon monoxide dehydrogenase accessory protein [Rhodococcus sp. HNM0563]|uniref:XdhC family protein n=1 Tax=unclassified Rhodococcus (in: high G+C Gram-positive bacteria) TaxID=192944 RepID=UPI00146A2AAC|nr:MULTISPECIES: XdhC family protein [unclassified Rhodococcus (in: high G+C Gram-positive bacteria)]MCK0092362.1 XdhC family protein [Rhodococcus sp. F64268]NLU63109.1 carbon monoxide dehydrogenase accessory protein [Rhodococcus sp. HNM0563]
MDLSIRETQLHEKRLPFVRATVVRAQPPTSAHSGDCALVLVDGTIEGFVGGQCTESSVRAAAQQVLDRGESLLLRVVPADSKGFPETPGATIAVNPCMSGGAMEIFLEPQLPPTLVAVSGTSPVAQAVEDFARRVGYTVEAVHRSSVPSGASVVILAMHGGDEAGVIRSALDAGAGYIGLVASRTRGAAVLDELELTSDERARIHTPAGLDVGARTAAEIGLSIVTDIVRVVRSGELARAPRTVRSATRTAVDPVCGMTVTVTDSTPHLVVADTDVWFCCPGCRRAYQKEHAA